MSARGTDGRNLSVMLKPGSGVMLSGDNTFRFGHKERDA